MTKDIIKVIAMLAITAVCGGCHNARACHGTVPWHVLNTILMINIADWSLSASVRSLVIPIVWLVARSSLHCS